MSRRTKLLITAVFLVLLAVPVVYVAISWHPPNPLRFRLQSSVSDSEVMGGPALAGYFIVQVSIENRTPFPMYFKGAAGSAPHGPHVFRDAPSVFIFSEDMRGRLDAPFTGMQQTLIPAYGEIDVTGLLAPELKNSIHEGAILIHGDWQSRTRELATNAAFWIRTHNPHWVPDIFPALPPTEETMPLEIGNQVPRLPSAPTAP